MKRPALPTELRALVERLKSETLARAPEHANPDEVFARLPANLPTDGPTLADAWKRLGVEGLANLLEKTLGAPAKIFPTRVEGAWCQKRGSTNCQKSPKAYAYPKSSGAAPWVACSHLSCGWAAPVFDLVAAKHATRREAAAAIYKLAGLDASKLERLLESFPASAWGWAGSYADRRGKLDLALELAPSDDARELMKSGVKDRQSGRAPARPDEGTCRRFERALEAPAIEDEKPRKKGKKFSGRITDLVCKTSDDGQEGTTFSFTVEFEGKSVRLVGVDAQRLLSYSAIRTLTTERRVPLPALGRDANQQWGRVVDEAFETHKTEQVDPGEVLSEAVEEAVRRYRSGLTISTSASALDSGSIYQDPSGALLVKGEAVLAWVKKQVPDPEVTRAMVARAARKVGLVPTVKRLDGGEQLRLWSLPVEPRDGARSTPEAKLDLGPGCDTRSRTGNSRVVDVGQQQT